MSHCEASTTLTPQAVKTLQEIKLQTNSSSKSRCKNPQQNISKFNPITHKNICYGQAGLSPVMKLVPHLNTNECNPPHQQAKEVKSGQHGKAFDKPNTHPC
jgi:hypothetical protein